MTTLEVEVTPETEFVAVSKIHLNIKYLQTTIIHSQKDFAEAMQYYPVSKERGKQGKSPLNAKECTGLRSILGGCQWLERTRADHAAETSSLQTRRNDPTVDDLKQANALLRKVKDTAHLGVLTFRKQEDRPKRILVYADASLNSVVKEGKDVKRTQAGWLVLLVYDTESLDTEHAHVLNFVTRKSTRVTKSTLISESVSRVAAVEDAIRIACWLDEMYSSLGSTKDLLIKQETGKFIFPIDVVTDAKSLHEVLISPMEPRPSDANNLLWLKWLREIQQAGITRSARWCSTYDMLSDALTKTMNSDVLLKLFRENKIFTRYASLCGSGVVDGYKGKPPTKKEKEEQGYHVVESILYAYYTLKNLSHL